jgi:hypothetical protein
MALNRIPRNSPSQGRLVNAIESLAASRSVILNEAERGLALLAADPSGQLSAEYYGVSVEMFNNVLLPRFQQLQQVTLLPLFADIAAS